VVYVATGTVAQPDQQQVGALAAAMQSLDPAVRFIWALPAAFHGLLPAGFDSALVLAWAPQQAILSHAAVQLFVTHGGLNSAYEGLSAGRPMIVMPFLGDQPFTAHNVAMRKLGAQVRAGSGFTRRVFGCCCGAGHRLPSAVLRCSFI
jgi:UDP:flavonoid glycosyltransferase YjiC (YdhE family)